MIPIPSIIFVKDNSCKYVMVNRSMADLYGTTPETMLGKTDLELAVGLWGDFEVTKLAGEGSYTIRETIAEIKDSRGDVHEISMVQVWPVKIPITWKLIPDEHWRSLKLYVRKNGIRHIQYLS